MLMHYNAPKEASDYYNKHFAHTEQLQPSLWAKARL